MLSFYLRLREHPSNEKLLRIVLDIFLQFTFRFLPTQEDDRVLVQSNFQLFFKFTRFISPRILVYAYITTSLSPVVNKIRLPLLQLGNIPIPNIRTPNVINNNKVLRPVSLHSLCET
uniref:Uncharacterized protein n=1 Tax=Solanum lycopersicum TaxID=4081 RepID=K4B5K6_SOLLC